MNDIPYFDWYMTRQRNVLEGPRTVPPRVNDAFKMEVSFALAMVRRRERSDPFAAARACLRMRVGQLTPKEIKEGASI